MSFEVGNMVTPRQGLFVGRIGMVMGFSKSGQFIEVSYLTPDGSYFIRHALAEGEFVVVEE
tara:strand:- start:351 stop:533 length:183 start_codon:yes stop_codon:yes gene_type:complete